MYNFKSLRFNLQTSDPDKIRSFVKRTLNIRTLHIDSRSARARNASNEVCDMHYTYMLSTLLHLPINRHKLDYWVHGNVSLSFCLILDTHVRWNICTRVKAAMSFRDCDFSGSSEMIYIRPWTDLRTSNLSSIHFAFLGLPTGLFTGISPKSGDCSISANLLCSSKSISDFTVTSCEPLLCSSKSVSDFTVTSLLLRREPLAGDLAGVILCVLGALRLRFLEPFSSGTPTGMLK